MKTNALVGAALDWAVAKGELQNGAKYTLEIDKDIDGTLRVNFGGMYPEWSTDWKEGGAIIERERIELRDAGGDGWAADDNLHATQYGETPLVAAMRCYVASMLGNDVEVPTELTQGE